MTRESLPTTMKVQPRRKKKMNDKALGVGALLPAYCPEPFTCLPRPPLGHPQPLPWLLLQRFSLRLMHEPPPSFSHSQPEPKIQPDCVTGSSWDRPTCLLSLSLADTVPFQECPSRPSAQLKHRPETSLHSEKPILFRVFLVPCRHIIFFFFKSHSIGL